MTGLFHSSLAPFSSALADLRSQWTKNYLKLIFGYHFTNVILALAPTRVLGFIGIAIIKPLVSFWRKYGASSILRLKGYGKDIEWKHLKFGEVLPTKYELERPHPDLELVTTKRLSQLGTPPTSSSFSSYLAF